MKLLEEYQMELQEKPLWESQVELFMKKLKMELLEGSLVQLLMVISDGTAEEITGETLE